MKSNNEYDYELLYCKLDRFEIMFFFFRFMIEIRGIEMVVSRYKISVGKIANCIKSQIYYLLIEKKNSLWFCFFSSIFSRYFFFNFFPFYSIFLFLKKREFHLSIRNFLIRWWKNFLFFSLKPLEITCRSNLQTNNLLNVIKIYTLTKMPLLLESAHVQIFPCLLYSSAEFSS